MFASTDFVLHQAQQIVLTMLRQSTAERYAVLCKASGLESDVFKFHIRKLVHLGLISKTDHGTYELTARGKEFANRIDTKLRAPQKQPKQSLLIVVSRDTPAGKQYLMQQRLRHPYWGYWGFISGPIGWGTSAELAAAAELAKQTGLRADCNVQAFYRLRDYAKDSGILLEDKLFTILTAEKAYGELQHTWTHGQNRWMFLDDIKQLDTSYNTTLLVLDMLAKGLSYATENAFYEAHEY